MQTEDAVAEAVGRVVPHIRMTALERAMGRLMRAPDHPPADDPPADDPPADDPPADDPPADDPPADDDDPPADDDSDDDDDADDSEIPDDADGYQIPDIEGLDKTKVEASPLVKALRAHALKHGLTQNAFAEVIADYGKQSQEISAAFQKEQIKALGPNAETRIKNLDRLLGKRLPADLAKALAESATTANSIKALERLMRSGRATTGTAPTQDRETLTREAVEQMMMDKRYRGTQAERDPAFIKKVDDWFQAKASAATKQ